MSTDLDKFLTGLDLKNASLEHYGIKGMRWGIRRSDDELAKLAGGQVESADAAKARQTITKIQKAKSLSAVSDAELSQLVNRMNTEKRFVEAKAASSVLAKGQSKIKTVLNLGDTANAVIRFADSPAGKLLYDNLFPSTKKPGKHRA